MGGEGPARVVSGNTRGGMGQGDAKGGLQLQGAPSSAPPGVRVGTARAGVHPTGIGLVTFGFEACAKGEVTAPEARPSEGGAAAVLDALVPILAKQPPRTCTPHSR